MIHYLKNYSSVFVLWLILSATNTSLSAPQIQSCTQAAAAAYELIDLKSTPIDAISDKELTLEPYAIGSGVFHSAFKAKYNGQNVIYVRSSISQSADLLSAEERARLVALTAESADRYAMDAFRYLHVGHMPEYTFDAIRGQAAADILDFEYYKKLEGVLYNGKPIAPKAYTLVKNKYGIVSGFLMEEIPGANMRTLLEKRKLKPSDIQLIDEEIKAQATALNNAGYMHGDLVPKNVMVNFVNGKPQVRLLDFNQTAIKTWQARNPNMSKDELLRTTDLKYWQDQLRGDMRKNGYSVEKKPFIPWLKDLLGF